MKIVIFGTGAAGRAIYRTFKNKHNIIAFVDSNKNLKDTFYDDIVVKYIDKISSIEFDKIAISGVWIEEMQKQLIALNIPKEKIWLVEDTELLFSSKERVKTTDFLIKEFANLMKQSNISYYIEGSSLLCLLRGQNLSDVSDVDILVTSKKDIEEIWEVLNQSEIFKNQQLIKVVYKNDKILTKKGEINKIIVKSNDQNIKTEPTIIDINLASDIGKYYILDYEEESYHYYNKEFVDSGRNFNYKDIILQIPKDAEKYVEQAYGKSWRTPAKKWSYLDYGNILLSNYKLKEFMEKGV
ncbi:hypothetical protein AFAEC_0076 [Aliarcobacter faecis]|uniref:nucleoside-diphosphate sugar epimerase/dehydratase n=1 Tax=Aliarcobacter faecis TaxID=1564138 RepID=UPI00047C9FC9|nr:hypothetical protein [Aliarcobacter faecis]QKF72298.1 hypothetical protein AFAEC_0076 [Aliarcobacter faecis]